MAFGDTAPWLPRRSSDHDVDFAMTLLLPLLLTLGALAAVSAAPMTASAAVPAPPSWRAPLPLPPPGPQARPHQAQQGASPRGPAPGSLGAALGGGLGAGIGGRTLGELAESELDRYAFLMLDPASEAIPAGVTRRITPKSVFIAPSINGDRDQCAEGYQQDEMGRCVKVIKVDAEKSWDLLLDKLNNQFADLPLAILGAAEPTTPPGPPPGPFQLAIPIAGLPAPETPAFNADADRPVEPSPSVDAEQTTEANAEEGEEEVAATTATTTPAPVEDETETPVPTAAPEDIRDGLVPEVVMLSSEEQPHAVPAPAAQAGIYLVNGGSSTVAEAGTSSEAPALRPAIAANQSDNGDANPIINTVNNSPLVTGESLVQEVPPSTSQQLLEASSTQLQQLLTSALAASQGLGSSTTQGSASSTATPVSSPSTTVSGPSSTESSSSASSADDASSTTASPSPSSADDSLVEGVAWATTPSPSTPQVASSSPSLVSSTTTESPSSTTTSTSSWATSDESRPSSSNLLRPSLLPVIAPDLLHVLRFPTERPSSPLRFPSIDVTFPTSRGGVAGSGGSGGSTSTSGGDLNRLVVDKPFVFPKDGYWPPLPPAPYWGLEQTRNRPQQQQQISRSQHNRYWGQSRPTLGFGGPNTLSTAGGGGSSSSYSSSSSSQEGSQARRRTHYRAGSALTHRSSSHRRGRDW